MKLKKNSIENNLLKQNNENFPNDKNKNLKSNNKLQKLKKTIKTNPFFVIRTRKETGNIKFAKKNDYFSILRSKKSNQLINKKCLFFQ